MVKAIEVLRGLEILTKVYPDTDLSEEHDIIHAGELDGLSKRDKEGLLESGWFENEDFNCWSIFT